VILIGPVHELEVELLLSIVLAVAEENVECYSTQWVVGAVGLRNSSDMRIARSVLAYIRFIPLPAYIKTLSISYPPI
jgi:hypothetical protein